MDPSSPNLIDEASLGDVNKLDFLADLPKETTDTTPEPTPAPKEETVVTEPVVEEPVVEEPPIEPAPVPEDASTRDYSNLTPEETQLFKQMSRKAYDHLYPIFTQAKSHATEVAAATELRKNYEAIKDQQFYRHPEAYRLSPEYNNQVKAYNTHRQVHAHWRSALAKLEAGEPIYDVKVDDKGNLMVDTSKAYDPSPDLKAHVQSLLIQATQDMTNAQSSITGVRDQFTNRYNTFESNLEKVEQSLLTEPRKHAEFVAKEKAILEQFPPEIRDQRMPRMLAGAWAMIQGLNAHIAQLNAQVNAKTTKQTIARAQGPGTGRPASSSAGAKINVDEYIRQLNEAVGRG